MPQPYIERIIVCRPEGLPRLDGEFWSSIWHPETQRADLYWYASSQVSNAKNHLASRHPHVVGAFVRRENARVIAQAFPDFPAAVPITAAIPGHTCPSCGHFSPTTTH